MAYATAASAISVYVVSAGTPGVFFAESALSPPSSALLQKHIPIFGRLWQPMALYSPNQPQRGVDSEWELANGISGHFLFHFF